MNVLLLPDVFLRKLMKTMEIKDRLMLRLTCRAFENLVANTHAGFFDSGRIVSTNEQGKELLQVIIGAEKFTAIKPSEDDLLQILTARNRLFSGTSFRNFVFDDSALSLPSYFIKGFTDKFQVEEIHLHVYFEAELQMSLQVMAANPRSEYTMYLFFLPGIAELLSLPSLEDLRMLSRSWIPWEISSESFFRLLHSYKHLHLKNVVINSEDWRRALQIISADDRKRTVQLVVKQSRVLHWLSDNGICEPINTGQAYGEFKIVRALMRSSNVGSMRLRYGKCLIRLDSFSWSHGNYPTMVTMTNEE